MEVLFLTIGVIAFGAYSTWFLATSISERVLVRAARHGRYADLGTGQDADAPVASRHASGKRRIGQASSLNSR